MKKRRSRPFYGWFALAGSMLTAFVAGGALVFSYGVFLPVMCAEFGWSRAVMSGGLSIGLLTFGVPSLLSGVLVAKFGPRINMIWGNLVAALALAGMYFVSQVWHVYVLYGLAGLGAGVGGYVACTTVANNWFIKKRSLAMGIFAAGGAMGGFIFPPLTTVIIDSLGWRAAWLVLAGIVFVLVTLVADIILVRDRPEDMGLLPDGEAPAPFQASPPGEGSTGAVGQGPWKAGKAVLLPVTWLVAAFASSNYFALGTMIGHQVAYVQDVGYGAVAAAFTMSLSSGVGIAGRVGYGVLALKYNIKKMAIFGILLQVISLGILLAGRQLGFIYVFAILFGISNGMLITAMPTIVGDYFGREAFAQTMGVVFAIGLTVESIAPVVAGAIYDATSTYQIAFILVAVFSLVGLASVVLARKPAPGRV
jgi:MFS family permease